jgi:hypothetical protein
MPGVLSIPKPGVRLQALFTGWDDELARFGETVVHARQPASYERGPPREPERLYLRHRALLL